MFRIPTKYNSRDFFKLLLLIFWGKDFVCTYIRAVLIRLPIISRFADYVIPGVAVVCCLLAFPYMVKRFSYKDLIFLLCVTAAYCVNLLICPNTYDYLLEIAPNFWTMVFPLYFLGLRIDPEEDVPLLYRMSMVNIVLFFVYVSLFGSDMSAEQSMYQGAMGRAYSLLPQILMIAVFMIKQTNVWNVVLFSAASVYLFYCGTRGAIVCLLLFLFLFILLHQSFRYNRVLYVVVAVLMALIVLFYEEILLTMRMVAREIGMSERIFNALLSESFFESGGRSRYISTTLEGIAAKPIVGYGIAGDRVLNGTYCHNIILEFLASFGVVPGMALTLALLELLRRSFFKTENMHSRSLTLLLFCASFIKLNLSSSYLLEGLFFLMVGVCVGRIREQSAGSTRQVRGTAEG